MCCSTYQVKQQGNEEHLEHLFAPLGCHCRCLRHYKSIGKGDGLWRDSLLCLDWTVSARCVSRRKPSCC